VRGVRTKDQGEANDEEYLQNGILGAHEDVPTFELQVTISGNGMSIQEIEMV